MKKNKIFLYMVFCCFSIRAEAQIPDQYFVHTIANPANDSIKKAVTDFWISYLYEENDSIQASYWHELERKKYKENVCLFCDLLFQYPEIKQLEYFQPYILSIERKQNLYLVKTIFWHFGFAPSNTDQKNQNPAGIVTVIVKEMEGQFYLMNIISHRTLGWKNYRIGKLNYYVEPASVIDTAACVEASQFCDSLAKAWKVPYDTINYYVTASPEELGRVLGFDFYFFGYTTGVSMVNAQTILASELNFYNKHELVHFVLGYYPNKLFSEGLATFIGGSHNIPYDSLSSAFNMKYGSLTINKINNILMKSNELDFYVLGAKICSMIYQQEGVSGLKKLGECPKDNDKLILYAAELLNISEKEFLFFLD